MRVRQRLGAGANATLKLPIVVPADAECSLKPLPGQPCIRTVEQVTVIGKQILEISAMNEDVSFEGSEFLMLAMRVTDYENPNQVRLRTPIPGRSVCKSDNALPVCMPCCVW